MRTKLSGLVLVAILAACGGQAPATQPLGPASPTPGSAATVAPAAPTTAPTAATPAPAATATTPPLVATTPASQAPPPVGGVTISETLTGGPDAGTHTASGDPNCSFGFMAPGVWVANYSAPDPVAADQLNLFAVESDLTSFYVVNSTIGPGLESRIYSFDTRYAVGSSGTVTVNDAGATAVIHAIGTTDKGVAIDVTVNCPKVTRT